MTKSKGKKRKMDNPAEKKNRKMNELAERKEMKDG